MVIDISRFADALYAAMDENPGRSPTAFKFVFHPNTYKQFEKLAHQEMDRLTPAHKLIPEWERRARGGVATVFGCPVEFRKDVKDFTVEPIS